MPLNPDHPSILTIHPLIKYCIIMVRTSDLIFFNSGALPNILHYITLHGAAVCYEDIEISVSGYIFKLSAFIMTCVYNSVIKCMYWRRNTSSWFADSFSTVCLNNRINERNYSKCKKLSLEVAQYVVAFVGI